MERLPEPELMNDPVQVQAYSNADFEAAHQQVVENFTHIFPNEPLLETFLDLGCGSGDVTVRFAHQFPDSKIDAVDGAEEMLKQAAKLITQELLTERITLHHQQLPNCTFENNDYDAIISNSLLHHLHVPQHLWSLIKQVTTSENNKTDTAVYVCDLFRPETEQHARDVVDQYASKEPEILRKDFYNSLLAAFTPSEVRTQIDNAGLDSMNIDIISDRHMLIYGYL